MHNDIAGIDQYPVALRKPFYANARTAVLRKAFAQIAGNSRELS